MRPRVTAIASFWDLAWGAFLLCIPVFREAKLFSLTPAPRRRLLLAPPNAPPLPAPPAPLPESKEEEELPVREGKALDKMEEEEEEREERGRREATAISDSRYRFLLLSYISADNPDHPISI